MTLEEGIEILQSRGKLVGAKKKKKNGKIAAPKKVKEVNRAPSGYQIFLSEMMKKGLKMGEAASQWKSLDIIGQQEYKNKSIETSIKNKENDAKNGIKGNKNGDKSSKSSSKINDINKVKKPPTGYQMYVSEMSKLGMKITEAGPAWKKLEDSVREEYNKKSSLLSSSGSVSGSGSGSEGGSVSGSVGSSGSGSGSGSSKVSKVSKSHNLKSDTLKVVKRSGYQIYVSEMMKKGLKMGEAASQWKSLDIIGQQEYKNKSIEESNNSDSSSSNQSDSSDKKSVAKKAQKV